MSEKMRTMAGICREAGEEEHGEGDGDGGGDGAGGEEGGGADGQETERSSSKGKGRGTGAGVGASESSQSEAGVILKIKLRNFMCHRHFEIKLCKQINFINGRNGSGKSAILAALQICLGAKANFTHRAKKLSDFIRHGWEGDAVVQVTVLNTPDGFKFDEYGESITVQRTIKKPSGGKFTLLSHAGKKISESKKELTDMLDMLNIQVDNPCAVLDQENSKKFLQGNDSDKFAFFMKATDLDRVLAACEATGLEITRMQTGHHQGSDQLARCKRNIIKLRKEFQQFESQDELEQKIFALKEELAWLFVEKAEKNATDHAEGVAVSNSTVTRLKAVVAKIDEKLADLTGRKEEAGARMDKGVAELTRLKELVSKAHSALDGAKIPLIGLKTHRDSLQEEEREQSEKKRKAAEAVKVARQKAKRDASDHEEKKLHHKLEQVADKLSNAERRRLAMGDQEHLYALRQSAKFDQEAADAARDDYEAAQKELNARQADLRNLSTEAFDPLTALARYMPGLVRTIGQNAHKVKSRFRTPPVGPLGASIQLKEEWKRYRVCIEAHLKNNVNSFVVSCQQDKTSLMNIMKSFRQTSRGGRNWTLPTIIVQSVTARHTPPRNPTGFLQIMQALNVTDDQAFNALIDQCSAEKICLFPSKDEAERACLIGPSGNYQRMPHGMYEAYYPSFGSKSCSRFSVNDGNIQTRMNVVNPDTHRRVLGVDAGTQRQQAETQLRQVETTVRAAREVADSEARRAKEAKMKLDEEEQERRSVTNLESQLTREKQELHNKLTALKAKKNDATDPTEHLEESLGAATTALEAATAELATAEDKVRETEAQIEPFVEAKKAAVKSHKEAREHGAKMSSRFEEESVEEARQQQKLTKTKARLAEAEEEVKDRSVQAEKAEAECKAALRKAQRYMTETKRNSGEEWDGKRVRSTHSLEVVKLRIQSKTDELEKKRESENRRGRSKDEVKEEILQATKTFKDKKDTMSRVEGNMKLLSRERSHRTTKWMLMRKFVANQTSFLFNIYLQEKGAAGEVRFDYDKKTLGLTYQKDYTDDNSQCSDIKQLSGGERSFATLALLLALGRSHECPFRVMDEFDIFMDAMSRNAAMNQILGFATKHCHRQFILITPQDLSSVTPTDRCRIHKMLAPRDSSQMTLDDTMGGSAS